MEPEESSRSVFALGAGPATLLKVGGKGASLARMARAGLPVPPGFLLTTDAYRAFVETNELQASIVALATDTAQSREQTFADIRTLFDPAHIPPDVVRDIERAYARLEKTTGSTPPVAVRSTATAEDLLGASFAGQHDSFMNIRGERALLDTVKRCWSSLWTAGADTFKGTVIVRRTFRDQQKRFAPPPFIPPKSDPVWAADPLMKRLPTAQREALFGRGVSDSGGKRVLVGSPSSPGRAEGIARVIWRPEDFGRFNRGDIVVARSTSPIWTPLLGIAAAAVTEVGGPFAHAAIVAREFGIPQVDGATDATRVIADGAKIVVDGTAGIVEI